MGPQQSRCFLSVLFPAGSASTGHTAGAQCMSNPCLSFLDHAYFQSKLFYFGVIIDLQENCKKKKKAKSSNIHLTVASMASIIWNHDIPGTCTRFCFLVVLLFTKLQAFFGCHQFFHKCPFSGPRSHIHFVLPAPGSPPVSDNPSKVAFS